MMLRARFALALLGLPLLAGCTNLGTLVSGATGAWAATTSANPAIGYAAGIGSKAAVDAVQAYLSRARHRGEQDEIVRAVGALPVGQTAPWAIHHKIPMFDNAHGSITVIRDIDNAIAPCREVLFTVAAGDKPGSPSSAFITTACNGAGTWLWAAAEPGTDRWGALQ
jgi:hypothetical protein